MIQKQNLMDAETQCLIFGRSLLLDFFSLAHQHYTTRHLVTPDHIFLSIAVRASRKRVRAHPKKTKHYWRGPWEKRPDHSYVHSTAAAWTACRRGSSNPPEKAIILIASFWDFQMSKLLFLEDFCIKPAPREICSLARSANLHDDQAQTKIET